MGIRRVDSRLYDAEMRERQPLWTSSRRWSRNARRSSRRSEASRIGVLFVHTATQPPLGADTWVQSQIIAGLDKTRVDVHVACAFGPPAAPTPTFRAVQGIPDVHLFPVDFGRERSSAAAQGRWRGLMTTLPSLPSFIRLIRETRRQQISVVHTTDRPRDALASVIVARLTGSQCIIHAHVAFNPAWMSRMLQWAMKRADALIAISHFVASTLVDAGLDAGRVHVVHNGIDISGWTPGHGRDEARRELDVAPDIQIVLTVCRLFPAKGTTELLRCFASATAERPNVRLVVVGREMTPGYAAELAALAVELGVAEHVMFMGQRSDVPRLMAAADIYAMPSMYEPFGLVYLEAMAMELPVIALNNGGTPEVVEHSLHGLLSEPGNLDQLNAHLTILLDDPDRCRMMGRRGRQRAESQFSVAEMARSTEAVYRLLASSSEGDAKR